MLSDPIVLGAVTIVGLWATWVLVNGCLRCLRLRRQAPLLFVSHETFDSIATSLPKRPTN